MFCCQCISTGNVGVIERFGKFTSVATPGLNCFLWPMYTVGQQLSLRTQELEVRCETKTKDNVFVLVEVRVQYQVIEQKVRQAAYELSSAREQIEAYVEDVVRATIPQMELDQAFESKETVAQNVKEQLSEAMSDYGYIIHQALVTDLNPDSKVRSAMNEINANYRFKEAAVEKAEADKVLVVKAAEADAESKYLSGVGVAKQRKAIIDGLRDSVNDFAGSVKGAGPKDVINLLMVAQYFDMLEHVGSKASSSAVYIQHSPHTVVSLQKELKGNVEHS